MKMLSLRSCFTLVRAAHDCVRVHALALLVVLGLTLLLPRSAYAADGDLDTTFGDPNVNGTVRALALQPDGKVLIGGEFTSVGGTTMYRVARLNSDGSRDTSFNDPNVNGAVYALVRQSDGKVLIGGYFTSVGGTTMKYVARLNSDGTRDTSFNDPNVENAVYALALQSDGKVLIGGIFIDVNGTAMWRVARLNSNGTLDTTFGNPQVTTRDGFFVTPVYALVVQSDGKVLIGGDFDKVGGSNRDCVARLNGDGSLDTTFTGPSIGSWFGACVSSLSLQTDGKVVMGGGFGYGAAVPDYTARLNSDGTLDTSFNPNIDYPVYALALQSDGKVLIGGSFTSVDGTTMYRVARLNTNGTRDTSFNNPNVNDTVRALALQSNGKVLIGGAFTSVGGTTMYRVARLNNATPTAVTLSSFRATAPAFDLAAWFDGILRRWRR